MKKSFYLEGRPPRTWRRALGLALVLTAVQGCSNPERDGLAEWTHTAGFREPEELQPQDGVYPLAVGPAEVTIEGKRYCLRSYNGKLTAPTLRVRAASEPRQVRLDFRNGFQKSDMKAVGSDHHGLVDFNTTNLHTHGLHVSPGQSSDPRFQSDNVLLTIPPKGVVPFRFDIDAGGTHPPGTFWYHAHVHGSTAIQVANGMAGALIIEGAVDQLPGIREARERLFVFQQIPYDYEKVRPLAEGEGCNEGTLSINEFAWATRAKRTLINGIPRPLIEVAPGSVERWRFIHAGVSEQLKVSVYKADGEGCQKLGDLVPDAMRQIAEDGITFPKKEQREHVLMAPGYRVDVMMKLAQEGTYCLLDGESPKLDPSDTQTPNTEAPKLLAVVRVDKSQGAPTGGMPSDEELARVALAPLDCNEDPTMPVQKVVFAQETDEKGNACSSFFNINCNQYNPDVPRNLVLGRTEEWKISSPRANNRHPFHIHVNAFTVCPGKVNGEVITTPRWKDTLYVATEDGTVRLRTKYEDFTGRFVLHCHLLQHEDQGMMEAVQINAP
jgi:FtsP/CotA-like multicopper oxidase with cupredoxin domain